MTSEPEGALVAYGESMGPPLLWGTGGWTRRGCANDASQQQCDDDTYLEWRAQQQDGLYSNTEGEFIGDFC